MSDGPARADLRDRDGRVVAFDDHRGLGEVEATDGVRYPFHCTAIADGTRAIEVDAAVRFRIAPGPLGRWEAVDVASTS